MEEQDAEATVARVEAMMNAEIRAEQAEYEALAVQAQLRARSLADVATEMLVRGDRIEVSVAGDVLVGTVVHVGRDLLVLRAARGQVDVSLTAVTLLRTVQRVRSGGQPPGPGAKTLRARMTEHQTSTVEVEVLLADGQVIRGRVEAAADDHVLLTTRRGSAAVPWGSFAAAWPA